MEFNVTILGCSSATPLSNRFPTSQLLNHTSRYFLLDCGEGTQIQLRRLKIKFQRIDKIFISHLHGDHYYGLIGLLSSYNLLGRKKKVELYCPKGLKEIIDIQVRCSEMYFNFPIEYIFLEEANSVLWEDNQLKISKIELNHRIPCWGFLFEEKVKGRNLRDGVVREYGIPFCEIEDIRMGNDFITQKGEVIKNIDLTKEPEPLRSYAYITDNRIKEGFEERLSGITTLYHEATFLKNLKDRAKKTFHVTSDELAHFVIKTNIKKLIIGHYSSRYMDHELPLFLEEIKPLFSNVHLGMDGKVFQID